MPQQSLTRSIADGHPRPDASMSLLTTVMDHSLDDGYAEAAARTRAGESGLPRTLQAKLWLGAGLVLAALVVTLGAVQAQHAAPAVAKERQELIDRVGSETKQADDLEHDVDGLRLDVSRRQQAALRQHGGDGARLVSLLAGATEVHGSGVKLVVDDAKDTESTGDGGIRVSDGFADTGRVRDRDLQRVVNGLWASGAEAMSVNGRRLTALSAIRAAGEAILVDNRPLVPPYTVLAIGDGGKVADSFRHSAGGSYLASLKDDYGVRTSLSVQDDVQLPAAPSLIVRTAKPLLPATAAGGHAAGTTASAGPPAGTGERAPTGEAEKRGKSRS